MLRASEVFDSLLDDFRDKDGEEIVYGLLEDEILRRVVHAWSFLEVSLELPEVLESYPSGERALWTFLWSFCIWDRNYLANLAGMTVETALVFWQRARDMRMIYPDGQISPAVRQFLNLKVVEEMCKGASNIANLQNHREKLEDQEEISDYGDYN